MRQRILTALLLLPVAVACILWLPTPWVGGLTSIVMLLGLWELTRLIGLRALISRLAYLAANVAVLSWIAWSAWVVLACAVGVGGGGVWLPVSALPASPG